MVHGSAGVTAIRGRYFFFLFGESKHGLCAFVCGHLHKLELIRHTNMKVDHVLCLLSTKCSQTPSSHITYVSIAMTFGALVHYVWLWMYKFYFHSKCC